MTPVGESQSWYAVDNGETIGAAGSEGGVILLDEEHRAGARITLEEGGLAAFAIVCGIYGWMIHTSYIASRNKAISDYMAMKSELSNIIALISSPEGPVLGARNPEMDAAIVAISQFVDRLL